MSVSLKRYPLDNEEASKSEPCPTMANLYLTCGVRSESRPGTSSEAKAARNRERRTVNRKPCYSRTTARAHAHARTPCRRRRPPVASKEAVRGLVEGEGPPRRRQHRRLGPRSHAPCVRRRLSFTPCWRCRNFDQATTHERPEIRCVAHLLPPLLTLLRLIDRLSFRAHLAVLLCSATQYNTTQLNTTQHFLAGERVGSRECEGRTSRATLPAPASLAPRARACATHLKQRPNGRRQSGAPGHLPHLAGIGDPPDRSPSWRSRRHRGAPTPTPATS